METALMNINVAAIKACHLAKVEATQAVIDKMIAFLGEKMDVDEEVQGWFEEFRQKITEEVEANAPKVTIRGVVGGVTEAKKKAKDPNAPLKKLTAVNFFIQQKMAELKEAGAPKDKSYFKQATDLWTELTDAEKAAYKADIKDRLDALNEERQSNPEAYKKGAKKTKKATSSDEETPKKTKKQAPSSDSDAVANVETKTKKQKPSAEPDLPQAIRFMEMMEAAKISATETKKVKTVLVTVCEDIKKELESDDVENLVFVDTFKTMLKDKKVLLGKKGGDKLMEEFEAEMLPAEEEAEDEVEASEEEDDTYY